MTFPADDLITITGPIQDLSLHRPPPMIVCMGNPFKVIRPLVITDTLARS
jgi:hypothetical protein